MQMRKNQARAVPPCGDLGRRNQLLKTLWIPSLLFALFFWPIMENIELGTYPQVHDPFKTVKPTSTDSPSGSQAEVRIPFSGLQDARNQPEERIAVLDTLVNETHLAPVDRGVAAWAMVRTSSSTFYEVRNC